MLQRCRRSSAWPHADSALAARPRGSSLGSLCCRLAPASPLWGDLTCASAVLGRVFSFRLGSCCSMWTHPAPENSSPMVPTSACQVWPLMEWRGTPSCSGCCIPTCYAPSAVLPLIHPPGLPFHGHTSRSSVCFLICLLLSGRVCYLFDSFMFLIIFNILTL